MNDRFRFRIPITNKYGKFKKFVYFDLFNQPAITCRASDIFQNTEQCTGLKDKNGKLIYEGDIVKTEDGDILGIKWGKTGFNTPELFTSVGFIMSIRTSWGEDYMQFDKEEPYYEVVGNIHENPELLEEK